MFVSPQQASSNIRSPKTLKTGVKRRIYTPQEDIEDMK